MGRRPQVVLDDAILQRVEGDQRQPPPGVQAGRRDPQELIDLAQLVVDRDAQRLEGPGGGVDPVAGGPHDAADGLREL